MNAKQIIVALVILAIIAALIWFFMSPKAAGETYVCACADSTIPITNTTGPVACRDYCNKNAQKCSSMLPNGCTPEFPYKCNSGRCAKGPTGCFDRVIR